ncbi:phage tail tape measure protein [Enterobacter hormaechei]|uniref:phage tail tape measure protein n=1 Tax=Enterobacter hormaechei TaxID=158836 RepID=UPI001956A8A6|nr:phage tail tape measure protein [Enterobacter hormaechei]UDV31228.1 phage tail tape measure protein [Enterobacter cloacae]MBM7142754.1 phage tail tape measure protein [Enterobacter hormaechei]MBM7174158.1 phage tail tape measure protein [Enterobacter hormaechei]MBM7292809.1 phage tail tape measure protein [Enterobacter hormaechei]MBN4833098.1 phage tail tape measure protein [Enterobacter hormaechei]
MAGKSLGTLTLDLVAKVGGFVSGMDKAERASQQWAKQVQKDAAETTKAFASIGSATVALAGAVGVAGFQLLKSTSKQIAEADRWAKSLNISTQELLSWQFAAEKAGVSGDQMADIFKDIGDKIGDAVLNKSGEAVDALNALGLSAEKLSKVSPDKQLLAIGESLGKISTNAEKTTVLESLGNDLSKLLPLFDNNNEKLKQFLILAKDFGVAPDPASIDDLVKVNQIFEDIEAQVRGLKLEISAGLAKVDLSPLTDSLDQLRKVLTDPKVLQGITNLVSEVAELTGWLVKSAAAAGQLAASTGNRIAAIGGNIDLKNLDQVKERIDWLQKNIDAGNFPETESIIGSVLDSNITLANAKKELEDLIKLKGQLVAGSPAKLPIQPATVGGGYALDKDETNGKTKPDSTLKKLESSFKSMETSYLRQIALIDTTGKKSAEVTEQQKLQFDIADGKLAGLNETQKTRLEQLASEVDRLNSVKKANEENIRLAEYVANLQRENANAASSLDADVIGAGLGDKARERMREQLDIEREFNEKREDLQRRFQSGDIKTSTEYDRYNQELDKALAVRLEKYRSHYEELDKIQGDWLAGAQDGLANWIDTSSDYYSQVSGLVGNTLDGLVDNMADALNGNKADWEDWANSVLSELQKVLLRAILVNSLKSAGDSGILGSLGGIFGGASSGGSTPSGAYDSAASGLTLNAKGGVYDSPDLSKFRNGIVNSPTMFAFAKGAGLMGEAGPEAIMPLTRTADGSLGVRMVDDAVSSVSAGGNSIQQTIQQHFTISGNGDAALKQAMQEAAAKGARDGAKKARQDMLSDFQTNGQGRRLLGV